MIHYDHELGLSDLSETVDRTVADLASRACEFDSIAVEGVSGLLVGAPAAVRLGKPLVVVRKDSDMLNPCWHVSRVENASSAGCRVLFLDDYVGGGATIRHVEDLVHRYTHGELTSVYQYSSRRYHDNRVLV